ncbi:MFS transporter [Nocardia sp. NBC_01327]|uniref:MFS transporter n=1 Tax=Nocardia sp. NBC_01327 TaxID=2903593 RepID=UPI002E0D7F5E|nr:MFS transporter [Nocardia sp. NBC_01327]
MSSVLTRRFRAESDSGFDRKLLAPMLLGTILNPINSSIIAVSLVPIGVAFGAPASSTAWLVSALYLATAIGQPVVGRLVDLYGPRRLYLAGATLTGIAGIMGVLAPNLLVLVLARIVLGFGTCAGYPASMYLIRSESERTGKNSPAGVLTALAVAGQTIVVIGPTLGGLLIHLGGWRTTFAINIPLAIACLIVGALRMPKTPAPQRGKGSGLDLPGIALFAALLVSLLLFLMKPQVAYWYLPVLAIAAGAALIIRELRTPEPFLDVRVLGGNVPLLATYGRVLLTSMVGYCFLYGFTQWLESGRGLNATGAGLILLPLSITGIAVSAITGRRAVIRGKLIVGGIAQILGCTALFLMPGAAAIWLLLGVAVIMGIPQGLNSLANQNAVYYQADPERIASSAGLLRTFTYAGAMGAAAAGGAFLSAGSGAAGLHHLALFMLVASGLFLALTLADRSLRLTGRPARDAVSA